MDLGKFDAARIAAVGDNESGAREALQHFREEGYRALDGFSDFKMVDARTWGKAGQVNHYPNAVIGGPCELHTIFRPEALILRQNVNERHMHR